MYVNQTNSKGITSLNIALNLGFQDHLNVCPFVHEVWEIIKRYFI